MQMEINTLVNGRMVTIMDRVPSLIMMVPNTLVSSGITNFMDKAP